MKIQPTSQTNPTFEKLYSPKKLRLMGGVVSRAQLLEQKNIKECAEKFDVIVKRGKASGTRWLEDVVPHFTPLCGAVGAGLLGASTYLAFSSIGGAILGGVIGLFAGVFASVPYITRDVTSSYSYDIQGRKKYKDGSEIKTENAQIQLEYSLDNLPDDFVKELEAKDKKRFLNIIVSKYPKDGVYDAKTILRILQSKEIKDDYSNGEMFNYHTDINGNSTLLMKFFDIKRTEENAADYDRITSIIKSTPNINYNQQDKAGITIIENILNSENADALDIVKDIEFDYTPYLDTLFNYIKNEDFKSKARNLKIKFDDPEKALLEEKSMSKFKEAVSGFDSPFCNSQEKAMAIWNKAQGKLDNEALKEVNMILYNYLPEPLRMEV